MDVIEALGRSTAPMSLADVARTCEITRATARRLLLTLSHLDYVTCLGATYTLRPTIMDLGDAFLSSSRLPAVAHPHLKNLSASVRDTCSLTILDGFDVVYVDRVKASRLMAVNIDVGTRFPAFLTSTGRVLLAAMDPQTVDLYLEELDARPLTARTTTSTVRLHQEIALAGRNGYSITDQELDSSMRSIAVPVRNDDDEVIAAINVSTHVTRTSIQQLRGQILPLLLDAATAIRTDLNLLDAESDEGRASATGSPSIRTALGGQER